MNKKCAWCNEELTAIEGYTSEGEISNGICTRCAIKLTNSNPRTAKELLRFVREPVFVINSDGMMKAANNAGLKMLGKDMDEIEDALGGDAFECSYASLEGGCGNTEHCKTCTIRNAVMDTLSTGRGYRNIPAFQSINTSEGPKIFRFYISTEKVEECILLRIDKAVEIDKA
jgi:predicted amidohydrolase YtcJ